MSIEMLKRRVSDCEDSLTERKLTGAYNDVIRTLVGFANSVPEERIGVLFIGVSDKGDIKGVENPDKLQKTIRNMCENECYPPIWANITALSYDERTVIAVEVPYLGNRPYFAGQAFIRRGSETVAASEDLFNELVLHRLDKCRFIMKYRHDLWRVEAVGKQLGASVYLSDSRHHEAADCKIEEITPHFVRFKNIASDQYFVEELAFINISWDEARNRPKIIIRYDVSR